MKNPENFDKKDQILVPYESKSAYFEDIYINILKDENLFKREENKPMKKLMLYKEIEFKTNLSREDIKEINQLLDELRYRFEFLDQLMRELWQDYLDYIKLTVINKENFKLLLQKSNADRLFLEYSMVRSMSFYLFKMKNQKNVNEMTNVCDTHKD